MFKIWIKSLKKSIKKMDTNSNKQMTVKYKNNKNEWMNKYEEKEEIEKE